MLRFKTRLIYGVFSILLSWSLFAGDCPFEDCDGHQLPNKDGEEICSKCSKSNSLYAYRVLVGKLIEHFNQQESFSDVVVRLRDAQKTNENPSVLNDSTLSVWHDGLRRISANTTQFSEVFHKYRRRNPSCSEDLTIHQIPVQRWSHAIRLLSALALNPRNQDISRFFALAYIINTHETIKINSMDNSMRFIRAVTYYHSQYISREIQGAIHENTVSYLEHNWPDLDEINERYIDPSAQSFISAVNIEHLINSTDFNGAFFNLNVNGKTIKVYMSKLMNGRIRIASPHFGLSIVELPTTHLAHFFLTINLFPSHFTSEPTMVPESENRGSTGSILHEQRLEELYQTPHMHSTPHRVLLILVYILMNQREL